MHDEDPSRFGTPVEGDAKLITPADHSTLDPNAAAKPTKEVALVLEVRGPISIGHAAAPSRKVVVSIDMQVVQTAGDIDCCISKERCRRMEGMRNENKSCL